MEKKVLLSIKDLNVNFRVRGRILRAIRGISLDIYENESIAIVGESGSGKSVFTKTFAGMLDSNGYIEKGELLFSDPELSKVTIPIRANTAAEIEAIRKQLDQYSGLEAGASIYLQMKQLEQEKDSRIALSDEEKAAMEQEEADLKFARTELFNLNQTLDPKKQKAQIKENAAKIKEMDAQLKDMSKKHEALIEEKKREASADVAYNQSYEQQMSTLKSAYQKAIDVEISEEIKGRNAILAKEVYMSANRQAFKAKENIRGRLLEAIRHAFEEGVDFTDDMAVNRVFYQVAFRVKYVDETANEFHGFCAWDLAKVKRAADWGRVRGRRISTVFQDPMTSLNPIITIGKQITSIIIKHQGCSEAEARKRAIELMAKVGIPSPEKRFDDYPFQYSGGMRQRIVIAIALSCQPKILICDEPTTALDVTIQAQILQLIKDLQKEFGFTTVFITHDLGVVANIAERVAVMYAGQIIEVGTVEEVFHDPKHPYTWALLSSLPQLAERNTELYSITGTPPSLYNGIKGDAFAPRNPYCMKIDTLAEPPMFKVSDTHFAKTWLLDPRSEQIEKPEQIHDIKGKLMKSFHIE